MEKLINEKEKIKFTDGERRQLISSVKNKRSIWDKSQKLHSNRNAMKSSWKEIATELNKPEDACRQNWKSILDSKRYFNKKLKTPKKSGSECDLAMLSDESGDPWEFSEDLQFMTETSSLRTTSSTQLLSTSSERLSTSSQLMPNSSQPLYTSDFTNLQETSHDEPEFLPSPSPQQKNTSYTYKNTSASTKNLYLNEMRTGVSKVADIMTKLVDIATKPKETNDNASFLKHVNSLLLKLPNDVAMQMQSNIISMLYNEIALQGPKDVDI